MTGHDGQRETVARGVAVRRRGGWRWLVVVVVLLGLGGPGSAGAATAAPRATAVSGAVWSWGGNSFGELGDGSVPTRPPFYRSTPRAIAGEAGVVAIATHGAGSSSFAVKDNGTVWAWGKDDRGQLGDGTIGVPNIVPTQQPVAGLTGIVAVSTSVFHSLAVKNDGTVWAWGADSGGELGDGTTGNPDIVPTPRPVAGLTGVVAVATGAGHSLAVKRDGTVWAWGYARYGQLGLGTLENPRTVPTPQQIPGLTGVLTVSASGFSSLALKADGTVWGWGSDVFGELGDGMVKSPDFVPTPQPVAGLTDMVAISMGASHSLAVKADGTIWGWGDDRYGQLGDGTFGAPNMQATPQPVMGLTGVISASAGGSFSLALKADGSVWVWGDAVSGELGDSKPAPWPVSSVAIPQAVPDLTGVVAVGAGGNHALVLRASAAPTFGDVPPGDPAAEAIRQLAARGVIRGCDPVATPPLFCPNDPTLRAQMAALIVRAMGWSGETPNNPFKDQCGAYCIDDELWNAIGVLAAKEVAKGYTADGDCGGPGTAPCYDPRTPVSRAQVISFITRAMVAKGHWQFATADSGVYANVPGPFVPRQGHRVDVVTYTQYLGAIPEAGAPGGPFADYAAPATRAWFALVLWQAIKDR